MNKKIQQQPEVNRLNKDKIDLSKIETKELTGFLLLAYLVDSLMPIPG